MRPGKIVVHRYGADSVFQELTFTYPSKIITPKVHNLQAFAIAYLLNYGGGLVGGDQLELSVFLGEDAKLGLLTQGSTKVFKPSEVDAEGFQVTKQKMDFTLKDRSFLLLAPDPVTCFEGAKYEQTQIFHLQPSSNALVIDWLTSGRMSRGENWSFQRYKSVNEFFIGDRRVARDVQLLAAEESCDRSIQNRMRPYCCYASVFLCGEAFWPLAQNLRRLSLSNPQMQIQQPSLTIWSLTRLSDFVSVIRLAAMEAEQINNWLHNHVDILCSLVGHDVWKMVFPTR